jgi:hypothetical protein
MAFTTLHKMNLFFWRKAPQKTIAEIAEENHRKHREFLAAISWQVLGSEPDLVRVYTDVEGNNYYVSKNSWQGISRDRLAALEDATIAMEYRMSRETVLLNQKMLLTYFQKAQGGDFAALQLGYKLAWEMMEVMTKAPNEHILLEYAVHLIFTDTENPEILSPHMLQLKRERAEKDPGLKAFFLDMSFHTAMNSLPTLKQGGQPSSQEIPEELERKKQEKKAAMQKRFQNFKAGIGGKKK